MVSQLQEALKDHRATYFKNGYMNAWRINNIFMNLLKSLQNLIHGFDNFEWAVLTVNILICSW